MEYDTDSLYGISIDDWFCDFNWKQIMGRLSPYRIYIRNIMKYYKEHPLAVIKCKFFSPSKSSQDKPGGGVWLDLRDTNINKIDHNSKNPTNHRVGKSSESNDLDPELLQQIMDAEKTQYVWEYGKEKSRKIKIIDRN